MAKSERAAVGTRRWFAGAAFAAAVAAAYYLAARLSLRGIFFFQSEGITVFWAAAGISSGLLLGFGSRARWPVIAGVFVGAFLIPFVVLGRGFWLSTIFAACDVVEPVIIAGLIGRYFGDDFALDQLRKVVGFLAATIAGTVPSSGSEQRSTVAMKSRSWCRIQDPASIRNSWTTSLIRSSRPRPTARDWDLPSAA
jgi:hypothetical protein